MASTLKVAVLGVAALMLLTVFALPSPAAAKTTLSDQLTTETGQTDYFGGGDHFFVKFGSDAAFGIVWGTQDHPNDIYFVTVMARYLGFADLYDRQGDLIQANHTIKIYTAYAVKLDDILEYNDSNGNGQIYYLRGYDQDTGQFSNYYSFEQIYKRVDLSTAWNQSAVQSTENGGLRTWTFSLTATNLTYVAMDGAANVGDGVLNNVSLTFHLTADTEHFDNLTLPQYSVTMTNKILGMRLFYGMQQTGEHRVTGNVTTYDVKWDSSIAGWDFDPANAHPTLLVEFETIVGNYIPPGVTGLMAMMQYQLMVRAMGEDGTLNCQAGSSGTQNYNGSEGWMGAMNMGLRSPRLTFGGDWTKIGRLDWVTNVTVDGNVTQAHAQITAALPLVGIGLGGRTFIGFAALGGISYPGGQLIVHDPTVSSVATTDIADYTGGSNQVNPVHPLLGLLALIGVVAAVGLIVAFVLVRRSSGGNPPQYEKKEEERQGDWDRYYEKK